MSSYTEALPMLTREQRNALEAALTRWSTEDALGREIARNINPLERFLPGDEMRQLLIAVLESHARPLADIAARYAQECHRHVRAGGEVRGSDPTLIGRAVHRDVFVQWLCEAERQFFHTEANAGDFLDRLAQGEKPEAAERSILMSRFSAWVTWNPDEPHGSPFAFVERNSAEEVRSCLGLDSMRRWKGKPLLLLVYRRAGAVALFRPTIADAGLHRFFEPPQAPFDRHGWTKTWPEGLCEIDFVPKPRPEAVHAPALFSLLEGPIEQLW